MPSCMQQSIQGAIAFHRQGLLGEAEKLYNDVLKHDRRQFDALHLLGLLRYQQGRYSDAQLLIAAALKANAASVAAFTNYGLALHQLGRHDEALASYDQRAHACARPCRSVVQSRQYACSRSAVMTKRLYITTARWWPDPTM